MYPDLTRAYAAAFKQNAFPSTVTITLRANVFNTSGWQPAPQPEFTSQQFEETVAEINRRGMFPFIEFKAGPFNSRAPSPTDLPMANHTFNAANFSDLVWLYDFFGVPHGGTPGNDKLSPFVEVFSVPNFDTLGYTLKRGNPTGLMPPSIFLTTKSLAWFPTRA
jgi:hypothetical protein